MDPKLLFWSLSLANLGAVVWCVRRGIAQVRSGRIAEHRRSMLAAAALIGLFLLAYVGKVFVLGREDRSAWTALDYTVLYVHETCVAVMLLAGAFALFRTRRFRGALGTNFERTAGVALDGVEGHRTSGRFAAWGALLAFVTAGGVLAGMFLRAAS